MILPIVAYGDPVLKKVATDIEANTPEVQQLISDMFETMYNASGVGLAAPQIGQSLRLFVIDGSPFADTDEDEEPDPKAVGLDGFKKVFINAEITKEEGDEWAFNEGCLSIPKIREMVYRNETIHITYRDENWELHSETFDGYKARIIQHEYDHIEGKLFTEKINLLRKQLIKGKLDKISKGEIRGDYKMKFPRQQRRR